MISKEYPIDGISLTQVQHMAKKLDIELEQVEMLPTKPEGNKHKILLMMKNNIIHAYVQFSKKSNLVFSWSQLSDALKPRNKN